MATAELIITIDTQEVRESLEAIENEEDGGAWALVAGPLRIGPSSKASIQFRLKKLALPDGTTAVIAKSARPGT